MNFKEKKNEYKKLLIEYTGLIDDIVDIVQVYLGIFPPTPTEVPLGHNITVRSPFHYFQRKYYNIENYWFLLSNNFGKNPDEDCEICAPCRHCEMCTSCMSCEACGDLMFNKCNDIAVYYYHIVCNYLGENANKYCLYLHERVMEEDKCCRKKECNHPTDDFCELISYKYCKNKEGLIFSSTDVKLYKSNELVKSFNFDEGLQFHDMTKGDKYYFIVCKNITKKQYNMYVFTLSLDFCDILPVSCNICNPNMCQICAVGNSIYFLCIKTNKTGKKIGEEMVHKTTLIELC